MRMQWWGVPLSWVTALMACAGVVIIGAGALEAWTALSLAERGAKVVLVDACGAGCAMGSTRDERTQYSATKAIARFAPVRDTAWDLCRVVDPRRARTGLRSGVHSGPHRRGLLWHDARHSRHLRDDPRCARGQACDHCSASPARGQRRPTRRPVPPSVT